MRRWFKRLPRLSRGWRVARNLAVVLICLYALWAWKGYPLPTAEMEFRRLERENLLPRSEIVFSNGERSGDGLWVSRKDGSVFALDGTELYLRGRWFTGVREGWAVLACVEGSSSLFRSFPLGDGPVLTPLGRYDGYLDHTGYWVTQGPGETPEGDPAYVYEYHNFTPFLLCGAPPETVRAELTVREGEKERTGGGWALENGIWLLGLEEAEQPFRERMEGMPYTLRLYGPDGSLLLEQEGQLGT